ncbi:MAG TPA: CopG family transcriptional regulator [Candidatus Kapabacteria bacterium]|jgi:Zn-dependent M32 family carboxypeptidase|nr:CopG family transcriptional regulator [Candidatus Kapabacteria bacterium]
MIQTQISLPEKLDHLLSTLATNKGKKKEEIIVEAVKAYVHPQESTPEHTPEEILAMRRQAFGMWKDRTDLPDFEAIRKSMDRKLNWDDDR